MVLGSNNGIIKPDRGRPVIRNHQDMEAYLGRYAGLLCYLKEMDESLYSKSCAVREFQHPLARVDGSTFRRTFLLPVIFTRNRWGAYFQFTQDC